MIRAVQNQVQDQIVQRRGKVRDTNYYYVLTTYLYVLHPCTYLKRANRVRNREKVTTANLQGE